MPTQTREESIWGGKTPVATSLSSKQISKQWDARIKEESVFSARTTQKSYVDTIKKRLAEVIGGTLNPQEAERRLRETLRDLGYTPERGFGDGKAPPTKPGDIRDLSSSRRIQLIIDTNVKRARSMGQVAASEDPLLLMSLPAWRLTRTGARKKPRGNWMRRWAQAGAACGWNGALKKNMVALKTSPIWEKLGNGAGGFEDAIGSPFPPFAFGSGMAWVSVRRKEWQRLCADEGVADGLDAITQKARELKSGEGAVPSAPGKVQVEAPRGIGFPEGIGNPLVGAARQQVPGVQMPYAVDYSHRDAANNAIDDALDAITADAEEVASWAEMAEKAGRGEAASSLRQIGIDINSLRGRVIGYRTSVQTQPKPRSRAEQPAYDMAMDRYAGGARWSERRVERLHGQADNLRIDAGIQ